MAKYDPLREHLFTNGAPQITMTFDAVAELVGGLPTSAREHQAWWSNAQGGAHVQAHAWVSAGYR